MDNYYIIPGALIVTFILTLIISMFFKRPLRGLWIFFVIVFLATWASQLWIYPYGPVYGGIFWIPLLIAPVFFWMLILALIPPVPRDGTKEEEEASAALGIFFWLVLIVLLLTIGFGYYKNNGTRPVHPPRDGFQAFVKPSALPAGECGVVSEKIKS
jgi:hypothetical protein